MIYQWQDKVPTRGIKAQVAGDAIDAIMDSLGGQVTPKAIVAAAKPKRHPLNRFFTWDDSTAANLHRLEEARLLVRSLVVIHEVASDEAPRRAFLNVETVNEDQEPVKVYVRTEKALTDHRQDILAEVLSKLESLRDTYEAYTELSGLWSEVTRVIERHKVKKKKRPVEAA